MCYLKNLAEEQQNFDFDKFAVTQEEQSRDDIVEQGVLLPCQQKHQCASWSFDQQRLVGLFSLIERNNTMISQISKVLGKNSEQLEKSSIQNEQHQDISIEDKNGSLTGNSAEYSSLLAHPIAQKLFGQSHYKYRLEAVEKFPETIYKQRNFNLSIKLIDSDGKKVKNSNMIHLCFAVCNSEGQWIIQNRAGQPFMKGKTQSELVKGESEFRKLYTRDVSRVFPNGKVTIVVYCKPSTLIYTGSSSLDSFIDHSQIEPLIIEDITIKAKKKE